MNLTVDQMHNKIDETGFSPKLNTSFQLSNPQTSVWSQAWIALNIDIFLDGKKLASMHKADVIQEHFLKVEFQQILPRFGIQAKQIEIKVTPIGWMPTYPLHIISSETVQNEPASENIANVK